MLLGGFGAILLGLPYIFHVFGPTEAELVIWGEVSLCMGVVLLFLAIGLGRSKVRLAKVALAFGYLTVALLQVPPVVLWFAFHGSGISDGTPPSTFVAHWGYSVPHLVLLVASLMVVGDVIRAATPLKISGHRRSTGDDGANVQYASTQWMRGDTKRQQMGHHLAPMGHHLAMMGHQMGYQPAKMGHKGASTDTILTSVDVMVKR
jgi:hypothetical protein